MTFNEIFALYLQYFFILTPFFILALFLAVTESCEPHEATSLAVKIGIAVTVISVLVFLFGPTIFKLFGITLDAFRIGSGALLFMSAVSLVNGTIKVPAKSGSLYDLAVVPLAIPLTIGPGAMGTLIVLSIETHGVSNIVSVSSALILASVSVTLMLYWARVIHRWIGKSGISMLGKLTGLMLACLSCQMIFTGIAAFLK